MISKQPLERECAQYVILQGGTRSPMSQNSRRSCVQLLLAALTAILIPSSPILRLVNWERVRKASESEPNPWCSSHLYHTPEALPRVRAQIEKNIAQLNLHDTLWPGIVVSTPRTTSTGSDWQTLASPLRTLTLLKIYYRGWRNHANDPYKHIR